jgi:glycosyltransferase involved in cell wall biosynthesis
VLLSYNCEAFVAAAVESALSQDYPGPLEILISDDASEDGTHDVVKAAVARYHGPHRVVLRRRARNSGSKSAHLNDVLPTCTGELLVSFDGDDVALPSRVARIAARFQVSPRVQAVYSSFALIDRVLSRARRPHVPPQPPGGDSAARFAAVDAYASGATLAVRRGVVEAFGDIEPMLHEDVVLPFRAGLIGDVEFIEEPLVLVRRHAGSFTADWQRYASLERYRERVLAGIETAARVRLSRLSDIETTARRMPEQAARWERLRGIVERSWQEADMTRTLLDDSARRRLAGLLALWRAGAYREEFPQHLCLALAPELYLRYRRTRLGLPSLRGRAGDGRQS